MSFEIFNHFCKVAISYKHSITAEEALQKLKHYCAYQERCHQEVRDKLYSLGLHAKDVDALIAQLIEENYLSEERFAIQYAGGKFRLKQWGRIKIKYALKQKQISEYIIRKALTQIDPDEYMQTLHKLGEAKWKTLSSEKNMLNRKRKMQSYLLQKGYESDLTKEVIDALE